MDESRAGDGPASEGEVAEGRSGDRGEAAEGRSADRSETPLRSEALPESARCPFCGGTETEQFSAFGSAVSTSQYYCRPCRSVFEYMKWRSR